jgi:hypothetical protein
VCAIRERRVRHEGPMRKPANRLKRRKESSAPEKHARRSSWWHRIGLTAIPEISARTLRENLLAKTCSRMERQLVTEEGKVLCN